MDIKKTVWKTDDSNMNIDTEQLQKRNKLNIWFVQLY